VVCFDTYVSVDAFVQAVAAAVSAKMRDYDDGVWFVLADDRTWPAVPELVERFGIEPYADLASFLKGGDRRPRPAAGRVTAGAHAAREKKRVRDGFPDPRTSHRSPPKWLDLSRGLAPTWRAGPRWRKAVSPRP
jgi:hypothetical protein